jgi:hypothetical protein
VAYVFETAILSQFFGLHLDRFRMTPGDQELSEPL